MKLETVNRQFAIDKQLTFVAGPGGLPTAQLKNRLASATVALQGAHVVTYQPQGESNLLWLSKLSQFKPGKAIRGGIPICWPWFANHPDDSSKPAHGFARNRLWEISATRRLPDDRLQLEMKLEDDAKTRQLWPWRFTAWLTVTAGSELEVELRISNRDEKTFSCSGALHSYFSVSDIGNVTITGLEGAGYIDKVSGDQLRQQQEPLAITGETDRIYLNTSADCLIEDQGWNRCIRIAKQGSRTTVVWNPWQEKAAAMADFGNDEYRNMVCVETANAADDLITLAPGEEHRMQTTISVETAD